MMKSGGELDVRVTARDLVTTDAGIACVVAMADFELVADLRRSVTSVRSSDDLPLDRLVGRSLLSGFRKQIASLELDTDEASAALAIAVLDDVPTAVALSGFAGLRAGGDTRSPEAVREQIAGRMNSCAGFVPGATIPTWNIQLGRSPIPIGPAPVEPDDQDAVGWHPLPPLPERSMRRMRRLDLPRGATSAGDTIDAWFRDVHTGLDGRSDVVHEYRVLAELDREGRTVRRIDARAHVLPWQECAAATSSATRLIDAPTMELRTWLPRNLVGGEACTHLSNLLRSLADIEHLAELRERHGTSTADGTSTTSFEAPKRVRRS
jgi:Protein of unknown function (DUF2889)